MTEEPIVFQMAQPLKSKGWMGCVGGLTQASIAPRAEPGHRADEASSKGKQGLNYDHGHL